MVDIDKEIVSNRHRHTSKHIVQYRLYKSDKDPSIIPNVGDENLTRAVCFARLTWKRYARKN